MTVIPAEQGRPVTKSREMLDQGLQGTDRECSKTAGGRLKLLAWAQIEQAVTNSLTSLDLSL